MLGPLEQYQPTRPIGLSQSSASPCEPILQSIEVDVMDLTIGQFIELSDGKAGALDATLDPQRPQNTAGDGGLACSKASAQVDCTNVEGFNGLCDGLGQEHTARLAYAIESNGAAINNHEMSVNHRVSPAQDSIVACIRQAARDLGFSSVGIARIDHHDLGPAMARFSDWLHQGAAGDMGYLSRSQPLRADPQGLLANAKSLIMVTMNYLPTRADSSMDSGWQAQELRALDAPERAVVSLYARGRDYHKVIRSRLARLADRINSEIAAGDFRACVDSAPLLEVEWAQAAGLGWRGKHTLLLNRDQGSMFFLGGLLTTLELPAAEATSSHCGSCQACIEVCPTQAIRAPFSLDARRCISYLTIEHAGDIPEPLRPLMGNRVYGCDDCQLVCPWNRYAQMSAIPDFLPRHGLDHATLVELFSWTAQQFHERHAGSAILRIGYDHWLRNIAVGLGNGLRSAIEVEKASIRESLKRRLNDANPMVVRHVRWALAQGELESALP